jgi:hypothetical protein
VASVVCAETREVDVGDAVRVGRAEGLVWQILGDSFDAPAGLGVQPGLSTDHLSPRRPAHVVDEPLDQLPLVAKAEDEPSKSLAGVDLHHVPEDGPSPDLHQRLWDRLGALLQTGATSTAQNDHREGVRGAHGTEYRERQSGGLRAMPWHARRVPGQRMARQAAAHPPSASNQPYGGALLPPSPAVASTDH